MMVSVLRYSKFLVRLSIIVIAVFVILTYQNNAVNRRRIRYFEIWKSVLKEKDPNLKYILIWSRNDSQLHVLKSEQDAFTMNNCEYSNCYVTTQRNLINNNYGNFDAIVISGNVLSVDESMELPSVRYSNQTYIFATSESADNYPICNEKFDKYFNLTWTYRLDSDVPWPYFSVVFQNDSIVAPEIDVKWIKRNKSVSAQDAKIILDTKKFGAAWFASNCFTNSRRETFVYKLKLALQPHGITIDSIGDCGTRECSKDKDEKCMKMLRSYYFYLAFENSIAPDYVTEKVVKSLLHYTIPVVLGGANYSRFLPPNSYINAHQLGVSKTAAIMAKLIANTTEYIKYFEWRNHYHIQPTTNSVCSLCKELNKGKLKVYDKFRDWWNPEYKKKCKKRNRRSVMRNKTIPYLEYSCTMGEAPVYVINMHKKKYPRRPRTVYNV